MKIHRNKIVLIVSALQLLMLLSVISMVYVVSGNGRTVTLEMTGYDPYDALRGRYLRLSNPDSSTPYIRCSSRYLRLYDDGAQVAIQPRIEQYYLNERHADELDHSITWDSNIRLTLKIWRGMYVVDGLMVDGQLINHPISAKP